jgi:diacylglycerol kinase (ATP)
MSLPHDGTNFGIGTLAAAMDRWIRAILHSWRGICAASRSEMAFREELVALVIAVPLTFVIAQDSWKRFLLIAVMLFILVVELLNTALEKLADRVSRESDIEIGRVKDMGSAAVGLSLLLAGIAWALALAEFFGLL